MPLRTAADALAILREQLNAVRADRAAGIQSKARSVTYIISVAMKAIEVADIAERLAAIERRAGIGVAGAA